MQLAKRLIQAAIDKALQPWPKRREIEETGEWDLGGWFERYRLAEKLRAKLRPLLI